MEGPAPTMESLERPAKRVRRKNINPAVSDRDAAEKRHYFDLLKYDEKENIARCLSPYLNAQDWSRYIRENDVTALYEVNGDFGSFISTRFRTINFLPAPHEEIRESISVPGVNGVSKIAERGGENIKKILMNCETERKIMADDMLNELSRKLPNIESMMIESGTSTAFLKRSEGD